MFDYRRKILQTEPPGYLKALDDFGVTELMHNLAQAMARECDIQQLSSLSALLIKHFACTINCDWLAAYLYAVQMGRAEEVSRILAMGKTLPLPVDSPAFFLDAQPSRYNFGEVLYWIPLEDEESALSDWGIVIGRFYGYAPERTRWMWCYLLLLDPDSPSARWCVVDTAWEDDLERYSDE
ncbi:hypothetical protein [Lusitaniella coriacea]|uniref:hypothetical protein n=1 Tax=Lusitaniella coriacea TaxID=1983105 RepID=UPI003CF2093F